MMNTQPDTAFVKGAFGPSAVETLQKLRQNAFIRVINYHNTKYADARRFDAEIAYYSEHFSPVSVADLDEYFATRVWKKEKPGLIPAIFEGYRNHYEVMAPILEKYGFTGWFYVPAFFVDVPVAQQGEYAASHRLRVTAQKEYPDGRFALTWDEVRALSQNHEICCHTGNHFCFDETTSEEDLHTEIVLSKQRLEAHTQRPVEVFCWLGGKEYKEYPKSHPFLKEAGYKYLVGNLKLEKIK